MLRGNCIYIQVMVQCYLRGYTLKMLAEKSRHFLYDYSEKASRFIADESGRSEKDSEGIKLRDVFG